jgi:hypothetical protein
VGAVSDDFRARLARATVDMAQLRRLQKELMAAVQRVNTAIEAVVADDWEDRYITEGTQDLERFANGETP